MLPRKKKLIRSLCFLFLVLIAFSVYNVHSNAANVVDVRAYLIAQQEYVQTANISPIFTKEIQYWSKDIVRWSSEYLLDPNLIATVMQIESCGDPRAISRAGAKGLFQVMPFHFHFAENPFDPNINAKRGLTYLNMVLTLAEGNVSLALAGYNGGPGVMSRPQNEWPSETQRYVTIGVPIYTEARNNASNADSIAYWHYHLDKGLCKIAAQRLGIAE